MTNLIPPEAKRSVRKEYWLRTTSVWGFLFAIAFIVLAVVIVPTYVLFYAQLSGLLLEESVKENTRAAEYEAAQEIILDANNVALQLSSKNTAIPASVLLAAVEDVQEGVAVTVSSYSYSQVDGDVESITIQGTAVDRTALATFSENLKRSPYFTEAQVPVSSLIKDQDLPFNLTVLVAPKD